MIVDASAFVAIFLGEPSATKLTSILVGAPRLVSSTVTLVECAIVLGRRAGFAVTHTYEQLEALGIEFEAPSVAQSLVAADARLRYPLRFGDSFVYALAKEHNLPILTLDAEFTRTDAVLVPTP
jgi:ribonuclease VapC